MVNKIPNHRINKYLQLHTSKALQVHTVQWATEQHTHFYCNFKFIMLTQGSCMGRLDVALTVPTGC